MVHSMIADSNWKREREEEQTLTPQEKQEIAEQEARERELYEDMLRSFEAEENEYWRKIDQEAFADYDDYNDYNDCRHLDDEDHVGEDYDCGLLIDGLRESEW